jgi:hypothetical protein
VTEPTGHIVGTFVLEPSGADFKSRNTFNLLGSLDEWTSPIMAEVGPDGFVWVIDWYAYIVQHNPTPQGYKNGPGNAYETPRRADHHHGRIYRIVYTGANPTKPLDLTKATPAELVSTLRNDNLLWRTHAQRLLVEKQDQSVIPELIKLVDDESVDEIGLNVSAIHALWTLKGLPPSDDSRAAIVRALKHPSAGVRRNAVQVLPAGAETLQTILDAKLLGDPDAQVRLMSMLATADQPSGGALSERAGVAIVDAMRRIENISDRWIPDAAVAAAAKHDAAFLHAALARSVKDNVAKPAPATKPAAIATNSPDHPRTSSPTRRSTRRPVTRRPIGPAHVQRRGQVHAGPRRSIGSLRESHVRRRRRCELEPAVRLKPFTRYRLSSWIKTKGLRGATGALFNIHELQKDGLPKPIKGDTDWTQVSSEFATADRATLTINMLFGGWGQGRGEAWYDDVQLIELGPAAPQSLAGSAAPGEKFAQVVNRCNATLRRSCAGRHHRGDTRGAQRRRSRARRKRARWPRAGWPEGAAPTLDQSDRSQIAASASLFPPSSETGC